MTSLRLVVLDNMKEQINCAYAQSLYSKMLFTKQRNYERSESQYVVSDKLDMIGVHFLIFDISKALEPRLVSAMRVVYSDRAERYKLEAPIFSLLPHISGAGEKEFKSFYKKHGKVADCGGWFIEPEFTQGRAGQCVAEIMILFVVLGLAKAGYNNMLGCTNEKYKASKWFLSIGESKADCFFEHPFVASLHRLIMVENFDYANLSTVYNQHRELFSEAEEYRKLNDDINFLDFADEVFGPYISTAGEAVKVAA